MNLQRFLSLTLMDVKLVHTSMKKGQFFMGVAVGPPPPPSPFLKPSLSWTFTQSFYIKIVKLQIFYRRLSMLCKKLHERFFAAFFFRLLPFQSNISIYLLKVQHLYSTAGFEQVIPQLQLLCDSYRFMFQKTS